jgi:hypothetical protein
VHLKATLVSEFRKWDWQLSKTKYPGVHLPTPVAAPSKAWICGRSLAWIMGSNSAGGVEIFLLKMLRFFRQSSMRRADYSSRGVLQNVVSLNVIVNPRKGWGSGTLGAVVPGTKIRVSNGGLTEIWRYLKTNDPSSYITGHKMEDEETDRKWNLGGVNKIRIKVLAWISEAKIPVARLLHWCEECQVAFK